MRRAARTDANQQAIMDRLREIGCKVDYIKEPTDLLVGYRNVSTGRRFNVLLECKVDGGRLTKKQVKFIESWPGPLHIVRDPEEAVEIVLEECK